MPRFFLCVWHRGSGTSSTGRTCRTATPPRRANDKRKMLLPCAKIQLWPTSSFSVVVAAFWLRPPVSRSVCCARSGAQAGRCVSTVACRRARLVPGRICAHRRARGGRAGARSMWSAPSLIRQVCSCRIGMITLAAAARVWRPLGLRALSTSATVQRISHRSQLRDPRICRRIVIKV